MRRLAFAAAGALLLIGFALSLSPQVPSGGPFVAGPVPDSQDYAYAAESLLHGRYVVSWDGPERRPYYTPGESFLLMPAVALGGVQAAVWIGYLAALTLGVLAAALAWRLAGPEAGVLASALVLLSPAVFGQTRMVMSDLPTALAVVALVALLIRGDRRRFVLAGILAAWLVWLRPASLALYPLGLVAVFGRAGRLRLLGAYALGSLPLLVGLGLWQWHTLGSPLVTAYQTADASPDRTGSLASLFSLGYVFGPMWAADGADLGGAIRDARLPNGVAYALQLVGADGFLYFPLAGALGLGWALVSSRRSGPAGRLARLTLATTGLLWLTYAPYSYQSGRYLMPAAALIGVSAGVGFVEGWALVRRALEPLAERLHRQVAVERAELVQGGHDEGLLLGRGQVRPGDAHG